ncbi:DUF6387 family protein [Deefgea salmonis]|uniref:DUF6387 family protein n=1 Tax=Deefgea salmonis TaxID=2875502 RepID=A0ABS8BMC6_9NEIS|nr:DUF6387 family protein [Deefgea salmonis]MCB5196865.1 DUF6387 family protein [Deefgea salmonis]
MRRQKTKINSVGELPHWFSLDAYLPVAQFNAVDWAVAISGRLNKLREHGDGQDPDGAFWWLYTLANDALSARLIEKFSGETNQGVTEIERELMESTTHVDFHLLFGGGFIYPDRELPVQSATRREMYGAYLGAKNKDEINQHFEATTLTNWEISNIGILGNQQLYESTKRKQMESSRYLIEPYGDASFISIDQEASDGQLIQGFKDWLNEWRKTHIYKAPVKSFTDTDFAKWQRYQLLAYFDLSYWAKLEGKKITDDTLVSALFPNELDIGANDRVKLLREWHEKIFNYPLACALARQVGCRVSLR